MGTPRADIRPLGSFVLRTPLLPRDVLDDLGADLAVPGAAPDQLDAAIAADRLTVHAKLRGYVERPEVREALYVASPSLEGALADWLADPTSEAGVKAERSVIRYLVRMASRPTPFGLFAGNTVGTLGEHTRLELAHGNQHRRYTRLDGDYLAKLTDQLAGEPAIRAHLPHAPSSSLYRVAGRLHYAMRQEGKERSYSLVDLEPTEYLLATLARARGGALPGDLAQALCDADPEVTRAEADEYIEELIAAQVLVPDLAPLVTGIEALDDVLAQLAAVPTEPAREAARALAQAATQLRALDRGLGNPPAAYRAIHEVLRQLPVAAEESRLFQVNLVPVAAAAVLGRDVIDEIARGIAMVHRLSRVGGRGDLVAFREAFAQRYEGREVPLVEALDEESGIGFAASNSPSADASPLLANLPFPGAPGDSQISWESHHAHVGRRIAEALARDAAEIVLDDVDLAAMERSPAAPEPKLPDALSAMVIVARRPDGELRIHLDHAYGPSGATLFGRFCHSDAELDRVTRAQLSAEEAARPDAIFAEIVHLPDGRLANIAARPVLRSHEIVYLGRSGAPRDHQLPITDLLVSVRGDQIVLRSSSLGREVIPRLTNAHAFSQRSLGVYRFLASLQSQGTTSPSFDIGPFTALPHVPRIRSGTVVLREATWRLVKAQLAAITKARGADRIVNLRELRAAARLPRWVCVEDGDNVLPVDLDNVVAVDSFVHLIRDREVVNLAELVPASDDLIVRGPGGAFAHEIVVPFVRTDATVTAAERAAATRPPRAKFPPGSEWLFAKLYTGRAMADRVLAALAPLAETWPAWFFIRYGDPDWHVRLRVSGDPAWLLGEVMPQLTAATRPLLDDGQVWKVQLDTYERETERYGGARGIVLAERLFHADSVAALGIVGLLDGDAGSDARWRLALRGIDQLLADLGFDTRAKLDVMSLARDAFMREHGAERVVPFHKVLGERFRAERRALETLVDRTQDAASELAPALALFDARSNANAPIIAELRAAGDRGELGLSLPELAGSYMHMHANRLLRSAHRAHELVLYDWLARLYEGQLARTKRVSDRGPPRTA
jgi:thiopeptide-type bacteriocin biosynthesis protein